MNSTVTPSDLRAAGNESVLDFYRRYASRTLHCDAGANGSHRVKGNSGHTEGFAAYLAVQKIRNFVDSPLKFC
jgi:hypothetical protein